MTTSIITTVIELRPEAGVVRFYFDYTDQRERHKVISTGYLGCSGLAAGVVPLPIPFSPLFTEEIAKFKQIMKMRKLDF